MDDVLIGLLLIAGLGLFVFGARFTVSKHKRLRRSHSALLAVVGIGLLFAAGTLVGQREAEQARQAEQAELGETVLSTLPLQHPTPRSHRQTEPSKPFWPILPWPRE